jgi:hypothetical protein
MASYSVIAGSRTTSSSPLKERHEAGKAPTRDHLLGFYIPDKNDWESTCAQIISAGFKEVPSYNPYWNQHGRTFENIDGYRVVLQNEAFR